MRNVLLATDADWVVSEVASAIGGPDIRVSTVSNGKHVMPAVRDGDYNLVIADLQVGNMGGMAITMALHNEETGGRLAHVPMLMLLDRAADLHLARRSGADGWLIKPLDSIRLQAAVQKLLAGGSWQEGIETTVTPDAVPS